MFKICSSILAGTLKPFAQHGGDPTQYLCLNIVLCAENCGQQIDAILIYLPIVYLGTYNIDVTIINIFFSRFLREEITVWRIIYFNDQPPSKAGHLKHDKCRLRRDF